MIRAVLALSAVTSLLAAGCFSPVVGAQCGGDGVTECGGVCVDTASDSLNCGGCGVVCDGTCTGGVCDGTTGRPDAGTTGGRDGGGTPDAGGGLGGTACDVGQIPCADVCTDPDTDHENCGSCGNGCADNEVCSSGTCRATCQPPTQACGALCVDLDTDPDHCGACGTSCPSGLCQAGQCVDALPGHVVVIGHDYRRGRAGMNRLVGNAVFLSLGDPVNVLVWSADAPAALQTGTDAAIDQVASETGRAWLRTSAGSADTVPYELSFADVFLVYSQASATDAALLSEGDAWRVALDTFTRRGGTVVVLDGTGQNSGTYQVLEASGLFTAAGRTEVTDQVMNVTAPSDGIANNVPIQYNGETTSVCFDTSGSGEVVKAPSGQPVVIHRVNF